MKNLAGGCLLAVAVVVVVAVVVFVAIAAGTCSGSYLPAYECDEPTETSLLLPIAPGAVLVAGQTCSDGTYLYYASPDSAEELEKFYKWEIVLFAAEHPEWEDLGLLMSGHSCDDIWVRIPRSPEQRGKRWKVFAEAPANSRTFFAIEKTSHCGLLYRSWPTPQRPAA